ncbi:hypothetical protein DFR52_10517 [Hoeflea marina]|uniref:Uncharacterized protein n=1 Tax=Hoeflea marina TaxID=274592 RepID=A0A317PEJ3_9HYPH|nr:hypothetical protein [Hoeflea marina]PWV98040.1 hypothetical protein DFR52_10517 [Hoeflea marina]
MDDGNFWMTVMDKGGSGHQPSGFGAVRVALLFGTAAIALAVILTPILAERTTAHVAFLPGDYDSITTGSIPAKTGPRRSYTIRKSVLQITPEAVCIIDRAGHSVGDC